MPRRLGNEYAPDHVSPPGETLLEILEEQEMTQVEFATRTGRTPKLINEIVKGKAVITTETALQFERVLGVPSSFWNNRERAYREFLAVEAEKENLSLLLEWCSNFPLSSMRKLGWIESTGSKVSQLRSLLDFFGVASPEAWESTWTQTAVAYRKTGKRDADEYALATWLRAGEIVGRRIECSPFDLDQFRTALASVRGMTNETPKQFQGKIVDRLAGCGVALALVPELPRISASGATRWLSPKKALLQINLRYKTDDHFWFTLFHEAGHIIYDSKKKIYVDSKTFGGDLEAKANHFAAETLIPSKSLRAFLEAYPRPGRANILEFADELDLAPGIVVGQLQHAKAIPYSHCNDLKKKFSWEESPSEEPT